MGKLDFIEPDMDTFRGLKLAYEVGKQGGSMPTVYNAANERAVAMFLERKIRYLEIIDVIEYAMEQHTFVDNPSIEEILAIEQEVYRRIEEKWL